MEQFILVEKKKYKDKVYCLIANADHSKVYLQSELKKLVLRNEIVLLNSFINSQGSIEKGKLDLNIKNENEFYLNNILRRIRNSSFDNLDILIYVLQKLKSINKRIAYFENDKIIVNNSLIILKRFFDYFSSLSKDFVFLKQKYRNFMYLETDVLQEFKNKYNIRIQNILQNNGLVSKISNIECFKLNYSDVLFYKSFIYILENLFKNKEKKHINIDISFVLNSLEEVLNKIKFTPIAYFINHNYLLTLSDACVNSLTKHNLFYFSKPNKESRYSFLLKIAGRTEDNYIKRMKYIKNKSKKVNKLMKTYNEYTLRLINGLNIDNQMKIEEKIELIKILEKYLKDTEEIYKNLVIEINEVLDKKNNNDFIEILNEICSIERNSDAMKIGGIRTINNVRSIINLSKYFISAIKKSVDGVLNDCLSFESMQVISAFNDLSDGKKGILLYILDIWRYKNCLENKKKDLVWYSNIEIQPLLDLFTKNKFELDWYGIKHNMYNIHTEFKKAWLTSYYILKDVLNNDMEYIQSNYSAIMWNLILYNISIVDKEKQVKKLKEMFYILNEKYYWNVPMKYKLNLYQIILKCSR